MRVRKAVIPAAGFGTRFLPATRSVPKVMLPILDTPAIHHSVAEAAQAGIEQIVLVISAGHQATGEYFGRVSELEAALENRGNERLLRQMVEISEMAEVSHVYQDKALGLGHAVLAARGSVGDEPFAVFLPDDLIWSETPTIGSMIDIFDERGSSVVAVKEVPDGAVPSLGIVDARPMSDTLSEVVGVVEKPRLEDAPSNLAIIGRYVLTPEVFDALERVSPGAVGEIQLTDALAAVIPTQGAYAYRFPGVHFDVGTPLGLLKASIYAAMRRQDMAGDLRDWLKGVL